MIRYLKSFQFFAVGLILFSILQACTSSEVLYRTNWKDQYFEQLVRRHETGMIGKNDTKKLQITEKELYDRDMMFLARLQKQSGPSKWPKSFFIGNKLKKRKNDLLKLQSRELLAESYQMIAYADIESMIDESRQKSATYYYNKAQSMLQNMEEDDRFTYRKIHQTLDTVTIFESDFKSTDSLLSVLESKGKTMIRLDVPEDLVIPLQQHAGSFKFPWIDFVRDKNQTSHIEVQVRETKPSLQTYTDTLITCIVASKSQHDSLTRALYFDAYSTLQYMKMNRDTSIALVYANLLVKQARFCYSVDWKKSDQEDPYLFEVCEDFENIYKTYSASGNRSIVTTQSCPEIKEKTVNLTDQGVIGKTKQLTIRKLLQHLADVAPNIDQ